MLTDLAALHRKYTLKITGAVHIGAHLAEEAPDYAAQGINRVWWIEANRKLAPRIEAQLKRYPGQRLITALVYDRDDVQINFNISNADGMCSSVLPFGTHKQHAPLVKYVGRQPMRSSTLDTLAEQHRIVDCNLLCMDLQGGELLALRGGERFVAAAVDYVYCEVNVDELYQGCARIWELDEWLAERGFLRLETCMADGRVGWGDAFYVRMERP